MPMTRYTTKQAAKSVGVGYQTLLRWLYAKEIAEPDRMKYGRQNLRLWTKQDIAKLRRFKARRYKVRLRRKQR